MNAAEITDKLGLHSLRHRNWYIQATCATSGDGLYEGLDWLSNQLKNAKWSIPPSPLLSALCVWMCLKADSTGFSLVYPFLSLVQSCIRQRLCPVLSLIHMQECACVYVCVCMCVWTEGGSSLAVPFKIDTQCTARFSLSLSSPSSPRGFLHAKNDLGC